MSYKNPQNPGWVIANELTDAELSFLTTFAGLSYSEGDTLKIVGGVPAWVVDSSSGISETLAIAYAVAL